jgi:ABC-2 type transport system permease protein
MPDWAVKVGHILPFYYTVGAPTEIVVGRVPVEASIGVLATQALWVAINFGVAKLLWKNGIKRYTAVGM